MRGREFSEPREPMAGRKRSGNQPASASQSSRATVASVMGPPPAKRQPLASAADQRWIEKQQAKLTKALKRASRISDAASHTSDYSNLMSVDLNDDGMSDSSEPSAADFDTRSYDQHDAVRAYAANCRYMDRRETEYQEQCPDQPMNSYFGIRQARGKMPQGYEFDELLKQRPMRTKLKIDDTIEEMLDAASADGKRGRTLTGVKAWIAYCKDVLGTPAERPLDPNAPLWSKLEEEWLAMRFVCALVQYRGVLPETARVYFACVQGWHAREFGVKIGGGLKLERLPAILKGLKRKGDNTPRPKRRGISPKMLRTAMDKLLDPNNPTHANIRAALALALQGLLRADEYTERGGKTTKNTLMRSDLVELSAERLVAMIHPCKNTNHLGGKTCELVIGAGGKYVDAVWEMRNLLRVDRSSKSSGQVPLFRDPINNRPLSYETVDRITNELLEAIGEDPTHFGTHSYRIGGATALFAQGASDTIIRTMGRWSSDIHQLYLRACFEQTVEWTKRAGSADCTQIAADFDFDEVSYY